MLKSECSPGLDWSTLNRYMTAEGGLVWQYQGLPQYRLKFWVTGSTVAHAGDLFMCFPSEYFVAQLQPIWNYLHRNITKYGPPWLLPSAVYTKSYWEYSIWWLQKLSQKIGNAYHSLKPSKIWYLDWSRLHRYLATQSMLCCPEYLWTTMIAQGKEEMVSLWVYWPLTP